MNSRFLASLHLFRCRITFSFAFLVFFFTLFSSTAHAVNPQRLQNKDNITGFYAPVNLLASYNLLGLRLAGDVGYRFRLFDGESRALAENFIFLGATASLTPAWMEFGALATVQPTSFFAIKGMYRYRFQLPAFFSGGVFANINDAIQVFGSSSPVKGHQDGEQRIRQRIQDAANQNNGRRVLPGSHIISVDATLRFQLKGFTALAFARYEKWISQYEGDNRYGAFYEGGIDIVINNNDDVLSVNGLLGYEFDLFKTHKLLIMALTNYTKAFQSGEASWRLGPAFRWTFAKAWGVFQQPNLLLVFNWYIEHRWRAASLDGVPLIAIQFGGVF